MPESKTAAAILAMLACAAVHAQSDSCSSPTPIVGYGQVPFTTVGATSDGITGMGCGPGQAYNDVWFCWTASQTAVVAASVCNGTTFDTVMGVYAGCTCPSATAPLACNDDSCACTSGCSGNYASRVQWVATAGSSYLIRLGAYGSTGSGSGTMTVDAVPPLADVTNPVNGHRYVAVTGTTWTASEAFAVQLGGHLVSIGDQAENDFVLANFGSLGGVDRRLWIGFNDQAVEGTWAWSDGSPASYTNWNAGEPNNSNGVEDYAEMLGSNGRWNDLNDAGAGYAHLAIIEFGGSPPPPPCLGDIVVDGRVDGADLSALLGGWGSTSFPAADLDQDGIITGSDLSMLLGAWGPCS